MDLAGILLADDAGDGQDLRVVQQRIRNGVQVPATTEGEVAKVIDEDVLSAAGVITTEFLKTFLDFPPRQEPGSFNVDKIIEPMQAACAGSK